MTGSLEIRPFGPDDDIEAELDLRRRAFGPVSAARLPGWTADVQRSIDAGELFGVFDGPQLVASARYLNLRQWWLGRSMPMAGVAGVKVAPEERGRGVGRALMTRLIDEIVGRGYPVSVLFPATVQLYRSLGWEIAGGQYETVLRARDLMTMVSPDPVVGATESDPGSVRRATPSDAAAVVDVLGAVHGALRDCGPTTSEPAVVADWLDDEDHFAYLADDGFLSYRWGDGEHELKVEYVAAASAPTMRALWRILASHASTTRSVRATLGPDDAIDRMTHERSAAIRRTDIWMLRVFDPVTAIEARGFPAGVTMAAEFELADQVVPENCGRWRLEVSDGSGKLAAVPASHRDPALRLGARGLAALFAGVSAGTLRRAGLVAGGAAAMDEALDAAFACRSPFMLYDF